ncbi:MAG: hypothetical protein ACXV76_13515 [Halobacteriota archaeon]
MNRLTHIRLFGCHARFALDELKAANHQAMHQESWYFSSEILDRTTEELNKDCDCHKEALREEVAGLNYRPNRSFSNQICRNRLKLSRLGRMRIAASTIRLKGA